MHGANGVVGTLTVGDRLGDTSTFDTQDARLLATLANHSSVALENGRLVGIVSRENVLAALRRTAVGEGS
jgi:CBS-domain-containing membrane protein